MNEKVIILQKRSTNGRYGVAIVGPAALKREGPAAQRAIFPIRGRIRRLGRVEGVSTFEVIPDDRANSWVLPAGDIKIHGGATAVLENMFLQSNEFVSVLLLSERAIIEEFGYKRRGSSISLYVNGQRQDIPAPILLAMGLVKPEKGSGAESPPPPPPLDGNMAKALAQAGLIPAEDNHA